MSAEHQFNPSILSEDQLKTLAFAIAGILKTHFEIEKPMTREEAAAFMNYGPRQFDKLVALGKFKAHRLGEGAAPRFLPSELLATIKKS